jgi:hypothetical protein
VRTCPVGRSLQQLIEQAVADVFGEPEADDHACDRLAVLVCGLTVASNPAASRAFHELVALRWP